MLDEIKSRAVQWQAKRDRVKRVVFGSAMVVLAVVASIIWKMATGDAINWLVVILLAAGGAGTFLFALSTYSNTMLVAMYYTACAHFIEKSDELVLVTGTIEEVNHVPLPYIGDLYQVTINVAGRAARYYVPRKLLQGLRKKARIRVLTHDHFVVRVEIVSDVEVA